MAAPLGMWPQQGGAGSPDSHGGGAALVDRLGQVASGPPALNDTYTSGKDHDLHCRRKVLAFAPKHCRPTRHKLRRPSATGVSSSPQGPRTGVYGTPQRSTMPTQTSSPLVQSQNQVLGNGAAPAVASSTPAVFGGPTSYQSIPVVMPQHQQPSTQHQAQYIPQSQGHASLQAAHGQQQPQSGPTIPSYTSAPSLFGPPAPQFAQFAVPSAGQNMNAVPRPANVAAQAAFHAVLQAAQTNPGLPAGSAPRYTALQQVYQQSYNQAYKQIRQQFQAATATAQGGFSFIPAVAAQPTVAPACWPGSDPSAPKYRWECHVGAGAVSTSGGEGQESDWVGYDEHITAQLEAAQKEGKTTLRFATRGFTYEVDLTRFMQTNTGTGKVRPIRRVTEVQVEFVDNDEYRGSVLAWPFADKGSSRIVLYKEPTRKSVSFESFIARSRRSGWERDVSFWDPKHLACEIQGRHGECAMVRVGFGSPEYLAVQEKFALVEGVDGNGQKVMAKHATLANSILSIFRIQNTFQMQKYCDLKDSISDSLVKTGRNGTEQVLWHGPSSLQAMEGIMLRGFDRMFAHRGANAFGKGCYFARDLMIADRYATSLYSEVDKRTCQAVILAKVLVGEYTLGNKDLYPPPMKPNTLEPYDSTVNNLDNPSIFVTYSDHQAIPYYIVTYASPFAKPNN